MATIEDLNRFLAEFSGLHADTVDRHGCKLRGAGLLPGHNEPLTALHAARLLVAVMAAPSPHQAVATVRSYETLPAVMAEFRSGSPGEAKSVRARVEDLPLEPGVGPGFIRLTRAFIPALSYIIKSWPLVGRGQLSVLGISRVPWRVMAYFELDTRQPTRMRFEYARVEPDSDEAASRQRLHVTAFALGDVLASLAQLVCPAPAEPAGLPGDESTPAEHPQVVAFQEGAMTDIARGPSLSRSPSLTCAQAMSRLTKNSARLRLASGSTPVSCLTEIGETASNESVSRLTNSRETEINPPAEPIVPSQQGSEMAATPAVSSHQSSETATNSGAALRAGDAPIMFAMTRT